MLQPAQSLPRVPQRSQAMILSDPVQPVSEGPPHALVGFDKPDVHSPSVRLGNRSRETQIRRRRQQRGIGAGDGIVRPKNGYRDLAGIPRGGRFPTAVHDRAINFQCFSRGPLFIIGAQREKETGAVVFDQSGVFISGCELRQVDVFATHQPRLPIADLGLWPGIRAARSALFRGCQGGLGMRLHRSRKSGHEQSHELHTQGCLVQHGGGRIHGHASDPCV